MLLRRHREQIAEANKPQIEPVIDIEPVVEQMVESPKEQLDIIDDIQEVPEVEHATPKVKKTTRKPKQ